MTSTPPSKLKTLQGVFDTPKIVYRRDFVRENKLNLKELQKLTNKNKQQSTIPMQANRASRQQQHNYAQQQQQQRGTSQQRAPSSTRSQQSVYADGDNRMVVPRPSSISQRSLSSASISRKSNTLDRCPSCARSNKGSQRSIAGDDLCDKKTQTEDILDEEFLYDALKKCVGSEASLHNKPQEINVNIEVKNNRDADDDDESHIHVQNSGEFDNMSVHSHQGSSAHDQMSLADQRSVCFRESTPRSCLQMNDTPRSNYSLKSTNKSHFDAAEHNDIEASGEPIHDHFDHMTEIYKRPPLQSDEMSVQSRATQISRRSKQGSHKLGSECLNFYQIFRRFFRNESLYSYQFSKKSDN